MAPPVAITSGLILLEYRCEPVGVPNHPLCVAIGNSAFPISTSNSVVEEKIHLAQASSKAFL